MWRYDYYGKKGATNKHDNDNDDNDDLSKTEAGRVSRVFPALTTANVAPQTLPHPLSLDWLGDDHDDGWPTTVSRTQPLSPQRLICPKTYPPRGRNPSQNRPAD